MTDKQIKMGIINDKKIADAKPPITDVGIIGWAKVNLFNSIANSILTVIGIALLALLVPPLLNWMIFNAVWSGGPEACKANIAGACWPYVEAKFQQFLYGQYTYDERWRIDLALWWLFTGIAYLVMSLNARNSGVLKVALIGITLAIGYLFTELMRLHETPMLAIVVGWSLIALLAYGYWFKPKLGIKNVVGIFMLIAYPIICFYLLYGGPWVSALFIVLNIALVLVAIFALMTMVWPKVNKSLPETVNIIANVLITIATLWLIMAVSGVIESAIVALTNEAGLTIIGTNQWGGFTLTLVIALTGIVASLPLGVVLALGRRSEMPLIRLLSTLFIELWRAIPLITVLFMASVMFPLFMPPEASIDQLLRALIGVALFSSAYMAEVIRGGLQAIPKGQYEGAMAMGMPYWKMMAFVVMPQALKVVIPGIVNTFIGLFKDTTLVMIIGLMDFLNTVQSGKSDPKWLIYSVPFTGYVFVALVFFVCCFSMAKYSKYLEDKLNTGHKH